MRLFTVTLTSLLLLSAGAQAQQTGTQPAGEPTGTPTQPAPPVTLPQAPNVEPDSPPLIRDGRENRDTDEQRREHDEPLTDEPADSDGEE